MEVPEKGGMDLMSDKKSTISGVTIIWGLKWKNVYTVVPLHKIWVENNKLNEMRIWLLGRASFKNFLKL